MINNISVKIEVEISKEQHNRLIDMCEKKEKQLAEAVNEALNGYFAWQNYINNVASGEIPITMQEHLRKAGSVKTEAKAKAAANNGKKGGRPRKMRIVDTGKTQTITRYHDGADKDFVCKIYDFDGVEYVHYGGTMMAGGIEEHFSKVGNDRIKKDKAIMKKKLVNDGYLDMFYPVGK